MANPNKPPESLRTLLPATALSASSVQNSPVTDDVPLPKRRRAVRTACDYCRDKKIRCSGLQPCPKCVELSQPCVFTGREADRLRQSLDHYKETLEYIYNILQERPEIIAEEVEIFRQIARDSPDVEEFVQRVSIIKRQGSGTVGSSRKQSRSTVGSAKSSFEGRPPSRPGDDEVMADGFGPSLQRVPDGEISDGERTSVESAPNRKRAKSAMLLDGVDEVDGVDGVDGVDRVDGVDDDEEPDADAESIDEIADFVANQYHSWHPDDIADQRPEQDSE